MIYIYITNKELSPDEDLPLEKGAKGYKMMVNPNHSTSRYHTLNKIEMLWDKLAEP